MSILDGTREASFKGAVFLSSSVRTTEGPNRANYVFVNTGRRASKFLGLYPPDFSFDAFIHDTDFSKYEQKRNALRQALSDREPGVLVHPTDGSHTCVAGKYTFTESQDAANVCKFRLNFFVADKSADGPVAAAVSPSQIKRLALNANRALQSASAGGFDATTSINKQAAKGLFDNAGSAFDKLKGIGDAIQKVSDFAGKALEIQQQAAFYAANPLVGFAALADMVLGVDGLTLDVFSKFLAISALFDFGDDDNEFSTKKTSPVFMPDDPATFEDIQKENNAKVFGNFMQGASTIEAFAQAGNTTFDTVDDINSYIETLDEQFDTVTDSMLDPGTPVDYSEAYEEMKTLKDAVESYFTQQALIAPRIEIINIQKTPATVLAYRLYGDSTRAAEILKLNNFGDGSVLSGDIKVLSI